MSSAYAYRANLEVVISDDYSEVPIQLRVGVSGTPEFIAEIISNAAFSIGSMFGAESEPKAEIVDGDEA